MVAWKSLLQQSLILALIGCNDPAAEQGQQGAALEERGRALKAELHELNTLQENEDSGLLVQLAFGAEADLDLYVTDPLLETVYFANKNGKSGGKISEDRRCDSESIRVEEVRFEAPLNGDYRIGIDYPNRCDDAGATGFEQRAAYTLSVLHDGKRQTVTGTVGYRFFEVAALDFTIATPDKKERVHEPTKP